MTDDGPVAVKPDGIGRTELFAGADIGESQQSRDGEVSSAGWMAALLDEPIHPPVSLVIGRPGRGVVRQIPLMTPQLAANMGQPDEEGWPPWQTQDVYLAFHSPSGTIGWSPDGRTLAYVAAVDGPSADIYVYDTAIDCIRRLTDGPHQPRMLGWFGERQRWAGSHP